jgi:hypothetical protein
LRASISGEFPAGAPLSVSSSQLSPDSDVVLATELEVG